MGELAIRTQSLTDWIVAASKGTHLHEIDEKQQLQEMMLSVRRIMKDMGMAVTDDTQYLVVRINEVVRRYFPRLTVQDFRLAFELASVGKLDAYLPKDSKGQADNKHYYRLTIDYVSRVLTAYQRMKEETIGEAIPQKQLERKVDVDLIRRFNEELNGIWLRWKYTGIFSARPIQERFIYIELLSQGYADDVVIGDEERKSAYSDFIRRTHLGVINKTEEFLVRKDGAKSDLLDFTAYEIARRKAIIKGFERKLYEC